MPIYEFKCLKCGELMELLIMSGDDKLEMKCQKCGDPNLERVMSTTNYSMPSGSGTSGGAGSVTRTCGSGSCTTYDIPGPR